MYGFISILTLVDMLKIFQYNISNPKKKKLSLSSYRFWSNDHKPNSKKLYNFKYIRNTPYLKHRQ